MTAEEAAREAQSQLPRRRPPVEPGRPEPSPDRRPALALRRPPRHPPDPHPTPHRHRHPNRKRLPLILDPTTAPASRAFLATVRVRCATLADHTDADLFALAAQVATLGYGEAHADLWHLGRTLSMHDHDFGVIVRETFVTLYPLAAVH